MRERLRAQQNDIIGMVQEDGQGQMLKHDHHLLPLAPVILGFSGSLCSEKAELILRSGLDLGRHSLAIYPNLLVLAVTSEFTDKGCLDYSLLPGYLVRIACESAAHYTHGFVSVHLYARSSKPYYYRLCTALTPIKHVRTVMLWPSRY